MFPCSRIPDGLSTEAEQAFATACKLVDMIYFNTFLICALDYLTWVGGGFACPGKSKYCQWDYNSKKYSDLNLAIPGACTETCTEFCSNYYCNGGCFKSWGWFDGFIPGNNNAYTYSTCQV